MSRKALEIFYSFGLASIALKKVHRSLSAGCVLSDILWRRPEISSFHDGHTVNALIYSTRFMLRHVFCVMYSTVKDTLMCQLHSLNGAQLLATRHNQCIGVLLAVVHTERFWIKKTGTFSHLLLSPGVHNCLFLWRWVEQYIQLGVWGIICILSLYLEGGKGSISCSMRGNYIGRSTVLLVLSNASAKATMLFSIPYEPCSSVCLCDVSVNMNLIENANPFSTFCTISQW